MMKVPGQRFLRMLLAQTLYAYANSYVIPSPEFSRSFGLVTLVAEVDIHDKLVNPLCWGSKTFRC